MTVKSLQLQLRRFYFDHTPCDTVYKYIGCSRKEFKDYIDSLLLEEMTPYNFGKVWQFDHIVPITLFKPEEYLIGYNYQNIFPMLNEDNKMKGASVHFSVELLESFPRSMVRDELINRCKREIDSRYLRYINVPRENNSQLIINQ